MKLDPEDERLVFFAPQGPRHGPAGTRLERFPASVAGMLQGRIGPLANLRSSSGCALLLRSDAPWVELELRRLRHHQFAPVGIDLEQIGHDGGRRLVHSGDLREREGDVVVRLPTGLERGGEPAELRLWLPLISTCAIGGLVLPEGSVVELAAAPEPSWLAIGDSLTQGFSVGEPCLHWLPRVARALEMPPPCNLGLGGLDIDAEVFAWALEERSWELITVNLGSNHAWRDADVQRVGECAEALLRLLDERQPRARVAWLMPPWKALEAGKGPRDFMGVPLDHRAARRLEPIRQQLREAVAGHPRVELLDGLMPADHRLLPDGLHPGALGMAAYGAKVVAALSVR